MKKSFLAITIVLTAVFLTSCGTTQEVSSPAEPVAEVQAQDESPSSSDSTIPAEEEDTTTENQDSPNENADSQENSITEGKNPADEAENTTSETESTISENEIPSEEEPEVEISEKVSEEDSYLSKDREEAPTSDERDKVSEYFIFDEPEVIVHDLPEEPSKEEKQAETPLAENKVEQTSAELAQNAQTAPLAQTTSQAPVVAVAPVDTENKNEGTTASETPKTEEETKTSEAQEESKEPEAPQITPSRSVKVKINQYLDVTYPGTGWVYIGESEKNAIFNYFGRKLGTGNTTFALRAKKAGTTLLHFYKNDALTGEYIDDYLEVEVDSKKGTGRVKAPSYADIVPAKPQRRIDRANDAQGTEEPLEEPKNSSQAKTTQSKETKNTKSNSKSSSTAKKQTTNKTSQNQKTQASSKNTKTTPAVASKDIKAPVTAPLSPQESDIKTVIQTTDAKNSDKSPTEQTRTEATAKSEPKKETAQNQPEPQLTAITPISSESEISVDESNPILRERSSSRAEGNADESLLEKAKKEFEEKKFADALKDAQEYYNNASTRLDEALFLLGQISESNSQIRDIRFAVDSYDMLVKRYPASKLWKDAKNRSIYLKRFYIDIR